MVKIKFNEIGHLAAIFMVSFHWCRNFWGPKMWKCGKLVLARSNWNYIVRSQVDPFTRTFHFPDTSISVELEILINCWVLADVPENALLLCRYAHLPMMRMSQFFSLQFFVVLRVSITYNGIVGFSKIEFELRFSFIAAHIHPYLVRFCVRSLPLGYISPLQAIWFFEYSNAMY